MLRWLVAGLACAPLALAAQVPIEGRWEGVIRIPERETRLVLDLARSASGEWIASMILPGLDVKGAAIAKPDIGASTVGLDVRGPFAASSDKPARLTASVSSDTMTGELRHAGRIAPVVLRRTGLAQVEPPRASGVLRADLVGRWVGEYELGGYPRRVTLELGNTGGSASAAWTIVGKQTTRLPVDFVGEDGAFVRVESQEYRAAFEGRLVGSALRGTIELGTLELPLTMQRAKDAP